MHDRREEEAEMLHFLRAPWWCQCSLGIDYSLRKKKARAHLVWILSHPCTSYDSNFRYHKSLFFLEHFSHVFIIIVLLFECTMGLRSFIFIYVIMGTWIAWCVYGSHRTALSSVPHLLGCLRWDLIIAAYARLAQKLLVGFLSLPIIFP